jgi:hypothetical protein
MLLIGLWSYHNSTCISFRPFFPYKFRNCTLKQEPQWRKKKKKMNYELRTEMTSTVVPKSRDPITSLLGRRYPHVEAQAPWPVVEEKMDQRWCWGSSQRANELRVSRNSKRSSYLSLQQQRWSHEAGKLPWRSRRRSPPKTLQTVKLSLNCSFKS